MRKNPVVHLSPTGLMTLAINVGVVTFAATLGKRLGNALADWITGPHRRARAELIEVERHDPAIGIKDRADSRLACPLRPRQKQDEYPANPSQSVQNCPYTV